MSSDEVTIEFHHIQMYADNLKSMAHYKDLENKNNEFSKLWDNGNVANGKKAFEQVMGKASNPDAYTSYGQDGILQNCTSFVKHCVLNFSFMIK